MNANEMDPHVSYLAFDGDTPMRILRDATGQIFTFEWVDMGYKVDGKTVSAMIPVLLSKNGELGDEYRIERKWRNKDTLDSQTAYLLRRQRQRKALHRIQSHISRHTRKGVLSWVASFIASLRETRST